MAPQAEQRPQYFALALALQSAETDDPARRQVKVDAGARAGDGESTRPQHRLDGGARRRLRREHVGQLTSDHQPDQVVVVGPVPVPGGDDLPVLEHGHPIADREQLAHPVTDDHDRPTLPTQVVDDPEDSADLVVVERRGRLVEDEQAWVGGQRLGQLDELLRTERKASGSGARVDVETDLLQQWPGPRDEVAVAHQAVPGGPGTEEHVLGHALVRVQAQLLVHRRDAGGPGAVR